MRLRATAPILLALVSLALPALADEPAEPKEAPKTAAQLKAEGHYKRARELYQLGRYREAIAHLETALKLDPAAAELLYNLGLVHERLGDVDEAIDAYKKYLKVLGPGAEKEEIDKIKGVIRRLEGAKSDLKQREAKRTEHRFTPLSASLLAGAGVALAATAYFGFSAIRSDRRAQDYLITEANPFGGRDELVAAAKRDAILADVFGATAIAATALSLTLYFTSSFPKADDVREVPAVAGPKLQFLPMPHGGAVRLEVVF